MTADRGRSAAVGLLLVVGALACGDDDAPSTQGSVGTPVTHDEGSTEDALISGILEGTLTCLWLDVGGERHALVLPPGSTTQQSADDVTLLDRDGHEVASTGDEVTVAGGFRPDEEPCPDAEATGLVLVAGEVRRADD